MQMNSPLAMVFAGALLAACGDTSGPTMSSVAGSYSASAFTTTVPMNSMVTNELAGGATVTIVLTAQGTTTGTLFIPNGREDGSDVIENLAGTWRLTGNTVTFQQDADTMMRHLLFSVQGSTLVADRAFPERRIRVTLSRTP